MMHYDKSTNMIYSITLIFFAWVLSCTPRHQILHLNLNGIGRSNPILPSNTAGHIPDVQLYQLPTSNTHSLGLAKVSGFHSLVKRTCVCGRSLVTMQNCAVTGQSDNLFRDSCVVSNGNQQHTRAHLSLSLSLYIYIYLYPSLSFLWLREVLLNVVTQTYLNGLSTKYIVWRMEIVFIWK